MRKAYFQMHLAILLWGFTGILGKAIQMHEGMIVWYRLALSAAALWLILRFRKMALKLSYQDFLKISLAGIIVTLHWITFYGAIKISNVSVALSCLASISLFTAVIEPLAEGKKLKISDILLGTGVMAGIFIIFTFQKMFYAGILTALLSALLAAVFTVMNKKLVMKHSAETVTFYEMTSGFIFLTFLLPAYLYFTRQHFMIPSFTDSAYLLLLSFACTALAFTISLKALKEIDAFTLNLSVNLEPVYSIVLAVIIFKEGEILNAGFYWGTLIILLTIAIHTFYSFRGSKNKQAKLIKEPGRL